MVNMAHTLEDRFEELKGFANRRSDREQKQAAAAIALSRKEIDQYRRLADDLRANGG